MPGPFRRRKLPFLTLKLCLYTLFFLYSWKSLCLRFLFPEAIPPSLSTLALPTWARRPQGMVKKASKVKTKGKQLTRIINRDTTFLMNSQNWGHLWEILFYKPYQKDTRKKSFFSGENGYFFKFWSQNFERVRPYGSKNIFYKLFNLKCLWA